MSTDLRTRLQSALLPAMRAGDGDTVAVVRSALAALANAEAVPVESPGPVADGPIAGAVTGIGSTEAPRRTLTPDEVRAVVESERRDEAGCVLNIDIAVGEKRRVHEGALAALEEVGVLTPVNWLYV